jgi:ubiquinone/menaquinone biosynthesis C-methylase UbiE
MNKYANALYTISQWTKQAIDQIIRFCKFPTGSFGLDAGCGIGLQSQWLMHSIGLAGKIIGVDNTEENLSEARNWLDANTQYQEQLEFQYGDLSELEFSNNTFDWVWCADVLWTGDQKLLQELVRVTKPGGKIALVFWSNQSLLCGYPELESRLNLAFTKNTFYLTNSQPKSHFMKALGWLQEQGCKETQAASFNSYASNPMDKTIQEALINCFSMFWDSLKDHVSKIDYDSYQQLCNPNSKKFILNEFDYFGFQTYSVFLGTVE